MPKVVAKWPSWYHSPDGHSGIFNSFSEVPAGWTKTRPLLFKPVNPLEVDEEDAKKKLTDLGVTIDPRWGKAQLQKVLDDRSSAR